MQPTKGHRKLVKHDDQPGEAHELTFSCFGRRQLLRLNSRCRLLAESVDRAMHTQHYELLAYVFMPEHVHLLVLPNENAIGISKLLFAINRPFSFRVKQQMIKESDPMLSVLTIRDRPNRLMGDTFSDQLNPKSLQSHPRIFHLTRIALFLVLPSSIVR